jgi:hypothetical protein
MKKTITTGNCFICGAELTKTKMRNHVLQSHQALENGEGALLIKVENYDKNYWLLLDVSLNATLTVLDRFLRKIWLECCGHMSDFYPPTDNWGRNAFPKSTKISSFEESSNLLYRYDFGSTTTLFISVLENTTRPPQKNKLRLLARNVSPKIECVKCGKPAEIFCPICDAEKGWDDAFYCKECFENHDCESKEYFLPVTNSPRMGVCAYDGDLDIWTFDPTNTN